MPQRINVQGVGVVEFPDGMSDADITHAIETDILSPRNMIAMRAANPPANRYGDPNPQETTAGEVALAMGKGAAHLVGIPTSREELAGSGKEALYTALGGPVYLGMKQAKNYVDDIREGYVPVVGRPVADVSMPARAVAAGRPPTEQENLQAIDSGTQLAGAAALAHPAVGAAAGRMVGRAGAALDASAQRGMANVIDPAGTNPLRESLGDILRKEGVRTGNPRRDLPRIAAERGAGAETVSPILDASGRPIEKPLTQEQAIWNEVAKAASSSAERQPITKGAIKRGVIEAVIGGAAKMIGVPHSVIAGVLGGSELVGIARKIATNPLWQTTSSVIKTDLAKALAAGDTSGVVSIGARVMGGLNLEDDFGHDAALHDVVTGAMGLASGDPDMARQIVAGKKVVYENADGSTVEVPHHIVTGLLGQIGWSVRNDSGAMAPRDGENAQDQAGRSGAFRGPMRKQKTPG